MEDLMEEDSQDTTSLPLEEEEEEGEDGDGTSKDDPKEVVIEAEVMEAEVMEAEVTEAEVTESNSALRARLEAEFKKKLDKAVKEAVGKVSSP